MTELSQEARRLILSAQKNEITEHYIYRRLAAVTKKEQNRKILNQIANDELRHFNYWRDYSNSDVRPNKFKVWFYYATSRVFGLTFGVKLMEQGEGDAQQAYANLSKLTQFDESIIRDEQEHERKLINLIDEERLKYISSMVLGLSDALVELTGALAGLTLTLQNIRLIAIVGLITGIAASFSMGASEYLATKTEQEGRRPLKAAVYTGFAYVVTVILLILPYLIFSNYLVALAVTLVIALIIVFVFTFYISVAMDLSFKKRFFEMAGISLGVATVTFGIGFLIRKLFNIDI